MLNKSDFVSKRNYYIIYIFDKVLWLIFEVCKLLNLIILSDSVINRVIYLEYAHLGDALLLTPAIRFAKVKNKDLEIVCFVSKSGAEALENNPFIAKIEIIDLPWHGDHNGIVDNIKEFLNLVKHIKSIKAEVIINFRSTSYHFEHIAMWLAGVPRRIGYAHKGLAYLLTDKIYNDQRGLIAQQKINLVEKWLGKHGSGVSLNLDYYPGGEAKVNGKEIFDKLDIDKSKKIIGINASARHNFLWPEDHFIILCNALLKDENVELLFLGTSNFVSFYDRINERLTKRIKSLVGNTTFDELAVVLDKLDLLITVDTGVRHLANALKLPVIVLLHGASTTQQEYAKYTDTEFVLINKVPCSPCRKNVCYLGTIECMAGITPETVFSQACRYLANE
jgi:heptosyltransferase-2